MRSIARVFVSTEDTTVGAQLTLARAAEAFGLDGVWVSGSCTGHSDSYVTATAAAIASATTDLRVGLILELAVADDILRLAEDIAVVDQCSSGRVELWLDRAERDTPAWTTSAQQLVNNLRSCLVGERELAVTPGPLQATVPVVARGAILPVPGAGVVADVECVQQLTAYPARTVLRLDPDLSREAMLATDDVATLIGAVDRLRNVVQRTKARDVVFALPAGSGEQAIDRIASVLAPSLRASDEELPDLLTDTLTFRGERESFICP